MMRVGTGWIVSAGLAAWVAAALASPAEASGYKLVYTAPAGQTFHPAVGAVHDKLIYGTDPTAGAAGDGILFTIALAGAKYTLLHSFSGADGADPNARLVVVGGNIYGTTQGGGSTGAGTVFGMSATGTILWSDPFGGNLGAAPQDGLALSPDGHLYGTASMGALSPGNGTLFRVGFGGHLTVAYRFKSHSDGHCPFTGVVINAAGDIFGTTVGLGYGGQPNGAVWEMVPGGVPVTQAEFTGGDDGEDPSITPTLDGSGHLWGVSRNGGAVFGAIWILSGNSIVAKYDFPGDTGGIGPNGPLLLDKDGNLYGTTSAGGSGFGVLFRMTPQGEFSTVHTFAGGADGVPTGSLAQDAAGNIYGGTEAGTIFRFTP
jgi:uncharacterized repeat protein (TIGR03803 family)